MEESFNTDPFEGPSSGSSYKPSDDESSSDSVSLLRLSEVPSTSGQQTNIVTTAIRNNQSRPRKVVRDPKKWKVNILKEKHQSGQEYVNSKGKFVKAKKVQTLKDCTNNCKFKCSTKITSHERLEIFNSYYSLSQNEKHMYILNTTERFSTARPNKNIENSYKKHTFRYYFNIKNDRIQVCKKYYLGTLSISQKPIYNVHNTKNNSNIPKPDGRGKNSSRKLSDDQVDGVIAHINSFPRVESHYCRKSTNREYLEGSLSLKKMYELYLEKFVDKPTEAVKFSMYRYIFTTKFNLSFHVRKSNRCDLCEQYKVAKQQHCLSDILIEKYTEHVAHKEAMREERKRDRENKEIPVLCFDLQNVITLPRADISSFFYKRKLNVYNLTAHLSTSKTIYCCIWSECASGRGGNELASAFKKILEKVVEENHITKLITWSDSCIPQNRNSYISTAVLNFLQENPEITEINMKYSTPGHSCIQEVDSAHSVIEKALSKNEIFSPIGLIRLLKTINKHNPLRVIQMQQTDFLDFGAAAKLLNFKIVPFLHVCNLRFTQCLMEISFKTSFRHVMFRTGSLRMSNKATRRPNTETQTYIRPKPYNKAPVISAEKKGDIKSMLKFMPIQDQNYFKALLQLD